MKTISTFLFFLIIPILLIAQRSENIIPNATHLQINFENYNRDIIPDSIMPEIFMTDPCSENLLLYSAANGGFIGGSNGYGDLEKANLFGIDVSMTPFEITSIDTYLAFDSLTVGTDGANITAKVYSFDSGLPGNLVATSQATTISEIDVNTGLTKFDFDNPISMSSTRFFIAIDFSDCYNTGENVGLYSTTNPCGIKETAFEKWSDGTWVDMSSVDNSWGLVINHPLKTHITYEGTVSTLEPLSATNSLEIYPNPVQDILEINYSLIEQQEVIVQIHNQLGQVIEEFTEMPNLLETQLHLNVKNYNKGIYYISIITKEKIRSQKFLKI